MLMPTNLDLVITDILLQLFSQETSLHVPLWPLLLVHFDNDCIKGNQVTCEHIIFLILKHLCSLWDAGYTLLTFDEMR